MAKASGKKIERKGKQQKEKKVSKKISALYDLSGDSISRKNRTCPKCGPGMFMGKHKDRVVCGQCGYVEYSKKEVPLEEKKEVKTE